MHCMQALYMRPICKPPAYAAYIRPYKAPVYKASICKDCTDELRNFARGTRGVRYQGGLGRACRLERKERRLRAPLDDFSTRPASREMKGAPGAAEAPYTPIARSKLGFTVDIALLIQKRPSSAVVGVKDGQRYPGECQR